MNCSECETLLTDALGQELAENDRPAFDAHLASCATCRQDYESSLAAIEVMESLPGPRQMRIERQGGRLMLHDVNEPPRRSRNRLFAQGALRYAAGIAVAFIAGYAAHAGLMVADAAKQSERGTQSPIVVAQGNSGSETLEDTILDVYKRNPRQDRLAKCMIAMCSSRQ